MGESPARDGITSDVRPIHITAIAYNERGLDYAVRVHHSVTYQWYCLVYGTVDMYTPAGTFRLEAGDALLMPPGMERSPRCRDRAPGYVWANFENRSLHLEPLAGRAFKVPSALRPDLLALVDELKGIGGRDSDQLIHALLTRLLIGMCRTVASKASVHASALNTQSREETARRIELFMRRNLHRDLTRAELARVANVSSPHLARVFREAIGTTLMRHLTKLRLERAKELLVGGSLPITAIAFEVGFSSFSHFCRIFRHSTGVTPSDYRRAAGHVFRRPRLAGRDEK